ncbi:cytochrome P450 4C1-like [Formica exsecta]|uniref:cytochrome P450 4C1-like n=1 Tax=Formica exsecta TaxID=72781 RepID=UPI001141DAAF|nr:cytochrome P450 4C1-like [Formica exsecta]
MFITLLLSSMFILLVYYYYVQYGRNGRLVNLLPGPPGHPIAGNAFQAYISAEEQWKVIYSLSDKYYPIFKFWIFFTCCVTIRHPNDLETILSNTKRTEKSRMYNLFQPWHGTGLFTSTSAKWHTRRKLLTHAFHFNILTQYADILIKEDDYMTKSLKDVGMAVVKDLLPFISEYTLNAICETAMGVYDIMQLIYYRAFGLWFYNDLLFSLLPQGRKQKKILKILHGFTEKVIAERKLYHERTIGRYLKNLENNKETEIDVELKKKRLAMLDLLIAASRDNLLTDLDIREEVDTFMFEGHDTTAMSMTFALLLLAEHKDIQERVRVEVDTMMQENGGKLTMRLLQNLPYLDRCLKETLRLYLSVFFIIRDVKENIHMSAGTILYLNIYKVHRDSKFWPNPEVFDPDRFLPKKIQNHHPYSYLPFSAGPRN